MKVKNLLDLPCSYFDNTFSKPVKVVKVRALFDGSLKKNKTQKHTNSLTLDKALSAHVAKHGKDETYNKLKELQVALTPSGVFGEKRTYEYLTETNPLVVIDIDNVDATKKYIDSFKKYPWVIGAGQTSSRKGVFLLIYIEEPSLIKEHFLALRDIFKEADDLKDITRLRYLSYGYSWVRKETETAKPFKDVKAIPAEDIYDIQQSKPTTKYDTEEEIKFILSTSGSIEESGGFHPWCVRVASRCNKKGISCDYATENIWTNIKDLKVIKQTTRYTQDRLIHDFKSIYSLYKHEHHIQTKVRITKSKINRFDKRIYDRCPKVLQELVETVDQSEEQEVIFFTAIILLGILFPNRCFRYFNNSYYLNLYGYILGDAASFKGKAKIVREALKPYQNRIDEEYKQKNDKKNQDIAYNKSLGKSAEERRVIDKIPDLNLFFDGNTSSAAMLKAMQDSPVLVMFETEGDTITKTWKTDWGNYSDILRKTFEHESLYSLKKNGQEDNLLRIRIDKPKLSVLVSSTEQQMRKVLNADETENGLMSRFLFYVVQNDKKWYNGWEANTDIDFGSILSSRINPDLWFNWLHAQDIYYTMSNEAHQYHQEYFNHVNDNWPDELFSIISLVRRAGTACARIAVLIEELNALDRHKTKSSGLVVKNYSVSGPSMLLAIDIMKIMLQHLFVAWQITYKAEDNRETNVQESDTRQQVIDALTKNPQGGYKGVAKQLGISRDTARYHIRKIKEEQKQPEKLPKGGRTGGSKKLFL